MPALSARAIPDMVPLSPLVGLSLGTDSHLVAMWPALASKVNRSPSPHRIFFYKQHLSSSVIYHSVLVIFLIYVRMFTPAIRVAGKRMAGVSRQAAVRTYASTSKAAYQWNDPLLSNNLLTEEELAVSESAESYCQEQLGPRVLGKFPHHFKP